MAERNLDFDTIIDRHHTNSLKYDFHEQRHRPADALPLWVADMDFRISGYIQDALEERVSHGIFGYTETDDAYREAVDGWMRQRHGWDTGDDRLLKSPGVVPMLGCAVTAFTNPGDPVLIQSPVYYCFTEIIRLAGRRVVSNDLVLKNGNYRIDFADFEKKIEENHIRLFLLCNPHNPGGRSWTEEELRRLGEICVRHRVIVVSDEIHEDITFQPHRHVVFEDLSPEIRDITVTCTSPGKSFNISGLQIANTFVHNPEICRPLKRALNGNLGYSQANTMGIAACVAAYTKGGEWFDACLSYIRENIRFLKKYLEENIPEIGMIQPEATYLVFLDFRKLGLTEAQREDFLLHKAKLWLDSGAVFGKTGEGWERINVAVPRATLLDALERLKKAVNSENFKA